MPEPIWGFPHKSFPTGWFQVGWSRDFAVGTVTPLHYFDQDLVAFRTESGAMAVLDAYCRHMGAHMAYGAPRSPRKNGAVVGECIECPWHGWQWDCDGRNTDIPYSTRPNKVQRVPAWEVREFDGLVFVWHDELGRAPYWEPPGVAEFSSPDYFPLHPHGATRHFVNELVKPQYLFENVADIAHNVYVHGAAEIASDVELNFEGVFCYTKWTTVYATNRRGTGSGDLKPVQGTITTEKWGVGVSISRLYGLNPTVQFVASTPVDHDHADIWVSVVGARTPESPDEPTGLAAKVMQNQCRELEADMPIWAHQRYIANPPFAPEEARGFHRIREHFAQFYPDSGLVLSEEVSP